MSAVARLNRFARRPDQRAQVGQPDIGCFRNLLGELRDDLVVDRLERGRGGIRTGTDEK
jgi:hypothetical protein